MTDVNALVEERNALSSQSSSISQGISSKTEEIRRLKICLSNMETAESSIKNNLNSRYWLDVTVSSNYNGTRAGELDKLYQPYLTERYSTYIKTIGTNKQRIRDRINQLNLEIASLQSSLGTLNRQMSRLSSQIAKG